MTTLTIGSNGYTTSEMAMLKAFYDSSVECCGGCDEEENLSWNNADDLRERLGGTKQQIGGVMSSLLQKCAITDSMDSARGAPINDFCLTDYAVMDWFNNR